MTRGRYNRRRDMPRRMRKPRRPFWYKKGAYGNKKIKQPVQYFVRTAYRQNFISASTAGSSVASINFQLANIPNVTDFTNLYDQYMIKAVQVKFIPRVSEVSAGASAMGNLWIILDYDDSVVPGSLNQMLQYQNVKRSQNNKIHTRYLKPAIANEVFATGIATAYNAKKNVWLDATNDAVEHYGIKIWVDQLPAGSATIQYDVVTKFYLAFKNVR